MKAVVAAFNQEKALVGAFSVITNLRMQLFEALVPTVQRGEHRAAAGRVRAPGRGRGGDAEVGLQPARARGQEVSVSIADLVTRAANNPSAKFSQLWRSQ